MQKASNTQNRLRRPNLPPPTASRGQDRRSRRRGIRVDANKLAISAEINTPIRLHHRRDRKRIINIVRRAIKRDIQTEAGTFRRVRAVKLDGYVGGWRSGDGLGAED